MLGDREIAIVRELTKVHEQVVRTTLAQAEKDYTENKIKGEIVLIVAGKRPSQRTPSPLTRRWNRPVRWWRKALPSTLPPRRLPR